MIIAKYDGYILHPNAIKKNLCLLFSPLFFEIQVSTAAHFNQALMLWFVSGLTCHKMSPLLSAHNSAFKNGVEEGG